MGELSCYAYHWQTMREEYIKRSRGNAASKGLTILELVLVCAIALVLASVATPSFLRISYDIRLKSAAANLSGLMQDARIVAAKNNKIYTVKFPTGGGGQACIYDITAGTPACLANQTKIAFDAAIQIPSSPTTGGTGQPSAYTLAGDNGANVYTNGSTLAYSSRGLPCSYSPGVCAIPADGYFVYYLQGTRPNGTFGWAAVVVTRTGRTKALTWNGSSWN
jgi:Tfp pilus assembly protein FimT